MPERRWLTVDEASQLLNVSKGHLYRLCATRRIPHVKPPNIGIRFDRGELERLMMSSKRIPNCG
jgi:excisionase family DNA binding protein